MNKIWLFLYLIFFKYLPATDNAHAFSKIIRKMRSSIGCHLFDCCGLNINIERGADFGSGKGISIGNNSGLGINCKVRGPLVIGNDVMMGPDVVIMTNSYNFERIDMPMNVQGDAIPRKVTIGNDVIIGAGAVVTRMSQYGNS